MLPRHFFKTTPLPALFYGFLMSATGPAALYAGISKAYATTMPASLNPERELSVYRFFSRHETDSADVATYQLNSSGLFVAKQHGRLRLVTPPACGTLLEPNGMGSVKYLGPGNFAEQASRLPSLNMDQVTFIELTVPEPRAKVEANPSPYRADRMSLRPDVARPDHVHIRHAGLWIIAGQTFFPHVKDVRLSPMPWQREPAFVKSGSLPPYESGQLEVDRGKYPLAYELGSALEGEPKLADVLLRTAVTIIADDVFTLRASPDQAHLFVHATDARQVVHFQQLGFEVESRTVTPNGRCVMVASLKRILGQLPVGTLSQRFAEIHAALPKLSSEDALIFLHRLQSYFRAELDFVTPTSGSQQKSPVVIHDFSSNYLLLLRLFAERFGEAPAKDSYRIASQLARFRHDNSINSIADDIAAEPFMADFDERQIVRITNLDDSKIYDSAYLPAVLVGTYRYLNFCFNELGLTDSAELIARQKTQLAIQSSSFAVAFAAVNLGGQSLPPVDLEGKRIYTIIFNLPLLYNIMRVHPQLGRQEDQQLVEGIWFLRGLLGNPLKF